MKRLTPQEEQVMRVIWQLESCTVKEAIELLPSPKPPYTTVASVFRNLENKEYIKSRKVGTTYLYFPAVTENSYKKGFLKGIVNNFFNQSYKEMVTFFAKEEKISPDELEEILNMIKNKK